jgi:hypothetical protein
VNQLVRDDQEVDTVRRAWSKEVANNVRVQLASQRVHVNETAKMARLELDSMREMIAHDSGAHDISVDVAIERPRIRLIIPLVVAGLVLAIAFGFLVGRLSAGTW